MTDGTLDQQQSLAGVDCQDLKSRIKPARKEEIKPARKEEIKPARKEGIKPARKDEKDIRSAGSLPLAGRSFYLDLPSGKNLTFLTETVQRLGGVVESFLSKEVSYVISSNREARQVPPQSSVVIRATPAGKLPSAGPGHTNASHKSVATGPVSRGKELLHKAIGSHDNMYGNSVLANAKLWGVRIMHTDEFLTYARRLESKKYLSKTKVKLYAPWFQPQRVARLKPPFLKIEDKSRQHRPLLRQFKNFPMPYLLPLEQCSPFESLQEFVSSKAPKGQRKSPCHERKKGYCECCQQSFTELQVHLQSPKHMEFALDSSQYALVDGFISQLTNDFLEFSSSTPLRVPLVTHDNVPFGLQMEGAVGTLVLPSDQAASGENSLGHSVSPKGFACHLEEQDVLHLTELGTLNTPMPLALQSLGSPLDQACGSINLGPDKPHKAIGKVANNETDPPWMPPTKRSTPLTCKRKLSCSPSGRAKKRQALAEELMNERLPNGKLLSGDYQVATVGSTFTDLGNGQTTPGHLGQPTVALNSSTPNCIVSKKADSVAQHCTSFMGNTQLAQAMLQHEPNPVPTPCQPLSTEEQSSSSEMEWDGPLLSVIAVSSRVPFKSPVDAELLGTCVSLQGSSYESHLCSALWKTPMLNLAYKEDLIAGTGMQMDAPSFPVIGTCQKN